MYIKNTRGTAQEPQRGRCCTVMRRPFNSRRCRIVSTITQSGGARNISLWATLSFLLRLYGAVTKNLGLIRYSIITRKYCLVVEQIVAKTEVRYEQKGFSVPVCLCVWNKWRRKLEVELHQRSLQDIRRTRNVWRSGFSGEWGYEIELCNTVEVQCRKGTLQCSRIRCIQAVVWYCGMLTAASMQKVLRAGEIGCLGNRRWGTWGDVERCSVMIGTNCPSNALEVSFAKSDMRTVTSQFNTVLYNGTVPRASWKTFDFENVGTYL